MDWLTINIFICAIGVMLLFLMPVYFKQKNTRRAVEAEYESYISKMEKDDKLYAQHTRQLNKNLNVINFWLKTGKDPSENEEDSETVEQEDRFFAGLMDPMEAKRWKKSVEKSTSDDAEDEEVKSIRVDEFKVTEMEPMEVEQAEMTFYYMTDYGEYIYYCVTPEYLENNDFTHVIYFTTSRSTNIPLVYPHKYEGAQMLSLYKHPAQTVWFLKNWKLIREGLEGNASEMPPLDESITDEFDL